MLKRRRKLYLNLAKHQLPLQYGKSNNNVQESNTGFENSYENDHVILDQRSDKMHYFACAKH
jgi:hypothetical protein